MAEIKPRYEFRIWGEDLGPVRQKLERMASPKVTESQEIYLISVATDKCNAKVRDGLMDIKVLVAEERGLEQWKPILKAGFPLESLVIAEQVLPSLELPAPALSKPAYELRDFLDDVMRTQPGVTVVEVSKTRYQFTIGACQAEYAQVTLNGVPEDTVAAESVDPDAVLQLIHDLGINDTNTSYIREIKRLLKVPAQPSGSR
jgi:exopolyphosphatase/guanosine-5'-triphosphate,3'-diphosphate pyrophosphatase